MQHEGITDHLTSGCPVLSKNDYLMRYNKVCAYFYYSLCKILGIETTKKGTHACTRARTHKPVCEHEDEKCCGIKGYIQKKNVAVNRSDIII